MRKMTIVCIGFAFHSLDTVKDTEATEVLTRSGARFYLESADLVLEVVGG